MSFGQIAGLGQFRTWYQQLYDKITQKSINNSPKVTVLPEDFLEFFLAHSMQKLSETSEFEIKIFAFFFIGDSLLKFDSGLCFFSIMGPSGHWKIDFGRICRLCLEGVREVLGVFWGLFEWAFEYV